MLIFLDFEILRNDASRVCACMRSRQPNSDSVSYEVTCRCPSCLALHAHALRWKLIEGEGELDLASRGQGLGSARL